MTTYIYNIVFLTILILYLITNFIWERLNMTLSKWTQLIIELYVHYRDNKTRIEATSS